ncbi:anoctamin-1-like isoform X3 [Branchiostoma floridae]|uniref:Anoctamin n=1 Tax=Branchiostoma floridae TaxID=7739 RepID=A0A9J7KGX5_BRAFL|nr:anoctamin-1-like isoform X3 [Branchiostoma floridae]
MPEKKKKPEPTGNHVSVEMEMADMVGKPLGGQVGSHPLPVRKKSSESMTSDPDLYYSVEDLRSEPPPGEPVSNRIRPMLGQGKHEAGALFFKDGYRRIDYVLAYPVPRRKHPVKVEHKPEDDSSAFHPEGEDQKARRRREFEKNLIEAGLDLERDDEGARTKKCVTALLSQLHGSQIASREPTKDHGMCFVRLHAPWKVLSQYAEILKIKMPTKKIYEIKERAGIKAKAYALWRKTIRPLQPSAQAKQVDKEPYKHISYTFSRDKEHMFLIENRDTFFLPSTRSLIVHEILKRTRYSQKDYAIGITNLIAQGVYTAAYPLHEGEFEGDTNIPPNPRQMLFDEWGSYSKFVKFQPLNLIRNYFGEKIGMYFAWLGLYTKLLIPSSFVGLIVFLYGVFTMDDNVPSDEVCEAYNITMCPLCDRECKYWRLSDSCKSARFSHLFDNEVTVFFSIFMSLWATWFLENWKRKQMELNYAWDLSGFEEEEEQPRPEYEARLVKHRIEQSDKTGQSYASGNAEDSGMGEEVKLPKKQTLFAVGVSSVTILTMFTVTLAAVFAVIMYRLSVASALAIYPNSGQIVSGTAVTLNLIVILILDEIYGSVAAFLTQLECPRTETEYEDKLIFKLFLLKFVNSYASIFYVAFFKGRFMGRPGQYIYAAPGLRMEECGPGGCLYELCIQLSIIMAGKQLIQNNVMEIGMPKLKKFLRECTCFGLCKERAERAEDKAGPRDTRWEEDLVLEPFSGLSPEYLEMIIQFGFVTIFVASFPLAPLLALVNNVLEIRLDARKFVQELRRPMAERAKDIGIWYNILKGITKISVIVNAFVIAITSNFIPRTVYQYMYSPDGSLHGFIDWSLSTFNVSDFEPGSEPRDNRSLGEVVQFCRYRDFRDAPWEAEPYKYNLAYWHIFAARLGFVICFQNVVIFLKDFIAWLIPDEVKEIKERQRREKRIIMEMLLEEERRMRQHYYATDHHHSNGKISQNGFLENHLASEFASAEEFDANSIETQV